MAPSLTSTAIIYPSSYTRGSEDRKEAQGQAGDSRQMSLRRRQALLYAMRLFDVLAMLFCLFLAAFMESGNEHARFFAHFLSMRVRVWNFLIFTVFVFVWSLILEGSGLYASKRLCTRSEEIYDIAKAVSLGTCALFAIALLFDTGMNSAVFLGLFWAASCALMIFSRLVLKLVLKRLRISGRNLRYVLLVGANLRALRLAGMLETSAGLGYRILGFADDECQAPSREFRESGYRLVSGLAELPSFLRGSVIDEVIICLPLKSFYQEAARVIAFCEEQGIVVRVLTDLFNPRLARSKAASFEGESVISFYTGNMEDEMAFIKRAMDIAISFVLIVILSPVLLMAVLLIKLTSPGPVFFVQKRVGLNKRRISVYKFRTMVPDAEKKQAELEALNEMSGAAFKIKDDPRVTSAGKFLRKTSIDELPQLFNVLLGDMSLVGPRPLPERDFENFDTDWHRRRFSVRPGITCTWQISGRNNISFDRWMELDMEYIDRWSLWLDIKILLGTIPAVLRGSGAA